MNEHIQATGSQKGKRILADFSTYLPLFKKIIPYDYKLITDEIAGGIARGLSTDQAEIAAFDKLTKEAH